jgi:hypothetical protein
LGKRILDVVIRKFNAWKIHELARQFGWDSIQVSAGTIMEKEI